MEATKPEPGEDDGQGDLDDTIRGEPRAAEDGSDRDAGGDAQGEA